jgi:hypothetical protein
MDLFSQNKFKKAIYLEYYGDKNKNYIPDPKEIGIKYLKGDGDFRSQESIELLKQADIVVTNPPFSKFREYIAQLFEYNKKFIIIAHQNQIKYKEAFKLLKDNKMWLGYGFKGNAAHFINSHYKDYATAGDHRKGMIRVSGVTWLTNLDISKRHEDLILYKKYNPEEYLKYDNYDAINGIATVNNGPGMYISPGRNSLRIVMDSVSPTDTNVINIDNVPIRKWFHVAVRVKNTVIDTYVNGMIASRYVMNNVPKQNYNDIYFAQNGGFFGKLSNLRYHSYALNVFEINSVVSFGPNTNPAKISIDTRARGSDYSYISNSWYSNKLK